MNTLQLLFVTLLALLTLAALVTVVPPASGSLRMTRSIAWMPLVPS